MRIEGRGTGRHPGQHKPGQPAHPNAAWNMQGFLNLQVAKAGANARAKRGEIAPASESGMDGETVARTVLSWRPLKPPGQIERVEYVTTEHALEADCTMGKAGETVTSTRPVTHFALPAGSDGGRSLFTGQQWKIRDALHAQGGAEVKR